MINISIDGIEIELPAKISIIEACKLIGISIPRFCYHESLSVAGNCRMCVIEVDTVEKPVASCATEAKSGMDIFTNNAFVKKARENVVETLLINHPLDCPICDQAGECDLQDQTKIYGSSHSRFYMKKKSSEDKDCNPLIKTIMTRCITCTRCVRFSSEVAGKDFFGTLNRGKNTEIGSYTQDLFDSEISGNVVDLCPVGALTSGPYSFSGRPWELRMTESIDINDSLGSSIYVNHRENSIYRILPKSNKYRNDTFISDIARFAFEYTKTNRLGLYQNYHYYNKILTNNNYNVINLIIDENCDIKTANLLNNIKSCSEKKINILQTNKFSSTSNNLVINNQYDLENIINDLKDFCFLIGTNIKLENAILNYKIRFKYRTKNIDLFTSGFNYVNNILNKNVFSNIKNISSIFEGQLKFSSKLLYNQNSLIIFGEGFINRFKDYYTLKSKLIKLNIKSIELFKYSNSEALKLYNFKNVKNNFNNQLNIFINTDDNLSLRRFFNNSKNNIWINSNGSITSNKSKICIPAKTHFEYEKINISLGYLPQKSYKVINFIENIKENHIIIGEIFNVKKFDINNLIILEEKKDFNKEYEKLFLTTNNLTFINKYPMKESIRNFYSSNNISKNSNTLKSFAEKLNINYKNLKWYI